MLLFWFLVLVSALTIYFYPKTEEGTYLREIVVAAIGSLLTILGAIAVALVAFQKQLRSRREAKKIQRVDRDSWTKRSLKVGGMTIDDIVVVISCRQHSPWTESAVMEWQPTLQGGSRAGIPGSELVELTKSQWLDSILLDARSKKISLTNGECVDMRDVTISYIQNSSGRRVPKYVITPAVEYYFDFLCSTANLDRPFEKEGKQVTLRSELEQEPVDIESVGEIPYMAKIGVGTAAITSDNYLVLGVRGRTAIAGQFGAEEPRRAVHIVAEGMIPEDRGITGRINPDKSARRALREELGISTESRAIGEVKHLAATGFFFDQLRYQPCFSYISHLDVDRSQLQAGLGAAQDSWEVEKLLFIRFDPENAELITLLCHEHPDLKLASNHAHAVLWFACLYEFGYFRMRDHLNMPRGRFDTVGAPNSLSGSGILTQTSQQVFRRE